MLEYIQYKALKWISPQEPGYMSGEVYNHKTKIKVLLGHKLLGQLRGKTVIDFGCGEGDDAIALAQEYALRVIGIDIREDVLGTARAKASRGGVRNCQFCVETSEEADAIVSIDSFEHFGDPGSVLTKIHELLKAGRSGIRQLRPHLVSPPRWTFVLCFSLGASDFFRKSANSMEIGLAQRWRDPL